MPINASPEYYKAYGEYLAAQTIEEKIERLKKSIMLAPKHKGSENLLAQMRGRLAKLKAELERDKKKRKGKSRGIKKEGHAQIIILGKENSGKSSLLAALTNARPVISEIPFTTIKPEIGAMNLEGIITQIIEIPANADSEMFSIMHGADLLLVIITSLEELSYWVNLLKAKNIKTKKIVVFNKADILAEEAKKIENLKDIAKISAKNKTGLEELKQKIFEKLELIRIYTKEPGKKPTPEPLILKKGASVKDMAEKIHKSYVERFIKAKVWGTSAKFPGQTIGIEHVLEDKDIVELYLK